jgi:hypothetical protein
MMGLGDVSLNLEPEFFQRGESALVAEPGRKFQLQFLIVEVAVEIEEVGFDAEARLWVSDRGSHADIQNGGALLSTEPGLDRINPAGRQGQAGSRKVCGGEAELPPKAVAADDLADERVRPPQEAVGASEIAASDKVPNSRAAHGMMIQDHGRKAMHPEIEFLAQPAQQFHIAAAPVAEGEMRADAQAAQFAEIARQVADKSLAGLLAERGVEVEQENMVQPEVPKDAQLFLQRIDERGHPLRRDHGAGMRVERNRQRNPVALPGIGDGLAENPLVPEVDPVKEANGGADAARAGVQLMGGAEEHRDVKRGT